MHVVRGGEEHSDDHEEHDEQEALLNASGQISDANHKFVLDKSNILLMGPTGSGDHPMSCDLCVSIVIFVRKNIAGKNTCKMFECAFCDM